MPMLNKRRAFVFIGMVLFVALIASQLSKKSSVAKKSEGGVYTLNGGKLVDGKFGKGFLAERPGDKMVLQTRGLLRREEGTIEMWVKLVLPRNKRPEWSPLFTATLEPFTINFMNIRGLIVQFADHSKSILFILGRIGDPQNALEASGLDWEAGEAHHVAVSWGGSGMRIYIDGEKAAENGYTGALPSLPERMAIGSYAWDKISEPARAVIDDVRISDVQRHDEEIAQMFRANAPAKMDKHTLLIASFDDPIVSLPSERRAQPIAGAEDSKRDRKGERREPERRGFKPALPASRSFYLGTKPGDYDLTPKALPREEAYKFSEENGDLYIIHHDEGVPWPEALEKKRYSADVEEALSLEVRHVKRGRKTYMAISAVKGDGLTDYWTNGGRKDKPRNWKNKQIDDPEVITAFLNYARDMIQRFHPDFMNYSIEVNLLVKNKKQWSQFVNFARTVYPKLKAENPNLPLFVSLQLDEFWKNERAQREAIRQILPYTDYIAVASYPYFYGYFDPNTIPRDYFSKMAGLAPEKPFAVAETAFTAENFDALGLKGPGSEEWQNDYLNFLLTEVNKLDGRFLVWFVPRDYDRMWEKIKDWGKGVELFKVWKDDGLLDGDGNPRKSFQTWQQWLKLPKR